MDDLIHVKGLSALNAFLQALPVALEKNILRGALGAGAKVVLAEAKAHAPVGDPSSENKKLYGGYRGALRDSLRVSTKVKNGRVIASVKVGGKTKNGADVYYAHMVEYSRPHTITAKNRKELSFGGMFFQSVFHPGVTKRPFMRPALDSQAQAAVIAAANYMRTRLSTKEGIDTSSVFVEGDK